MRGILTLAGEGSRMLPWTRGLRKELLPLCDRGFNGGPVLKPVANFVLETLIDAGINDVVLVVGGQDGGASVQNYFTIDREILARLADKPERLREIRALYERLENVRLRFAVQGEPRGFGDAVLRAQPFIGANPFVLHAGDAVLLERHRGHIPALLGKLRDRDDLDAVLLVRKVPNPRQYGVVVGRVVGREGDLRRLQVTGMEEKPLHPRSGWAATAVYCFSPRVFGALKTVAFQHPEQELELTAGIQELLRTGGTVAALVLDPRFADWRSVGSPEGYVRALRRTYTIARTGRAFGVPSTLREVPGPDPSSSMVGPPTGGGAWVLSLAERPLTDHPLAFAGAFHRVPEGDESTGVRAVEPEAVRGGRGALRAPLRRKGDPPL